MFGGIGLELLEILDGEGLAALGQVAQERQYLVAGFGHLGRQAQLGVIGEAQQFGQFLAQVENLAHHRAIIELAGIGALVGSAGAIRCVDFLAQGTVLGVGHHRVVAREFQVDQPTIQTFGLSCRGHLRLGRIGQAGQGRFVGHVLGPGLGRVKQLVGEAAAQLREFALDFGIALLLVGRQIDTRQAEIAQRVLEDGFLRDLETGRFRATGQGFEGLEQLTVLPKFGGIGTERRQAGLIGLAQLRAVADCIKMADRAPGSAQAIIELVHGRHQAGPGRLAMLDFENFRNGGTVVGQDLFNRRLHVLGTNRRERR
ncbi:hypothetical protein D3C80_971460 [compost metagenome]